MKVTIFGATGATGKLLVEQALDAGNDVAAYARDASRLGMTHERLTVVQGELADASSIERAVSGADAVISVLGPRVGAKEKPITQGTRNVLAAMKTAGVRRLIVSSTASATDPNDLPDLRIKALVSLVRLTMPAVYHDIVSAAQAVRASDRDWTIVRLIMLSNGPSSGKVRVGYAGRGGVGLRIARADVARFMLNQVRDSTYLRQAPLITN